MLAACSTLTLPPVCRPSARRYFLIGLVLVLLLPAGLWAGEAVNTGLVLPIPPQRIGKLSEELGKLLERPLERFKSDQAQNLRDPGDYFFLICDFNPEGQPNSSGNYGACYELAKKLQELRKDRVRAIAFLHGEVTRHSVLPVLACAEIVMSADAALGKVVEGRESLRDSEQASYEEIARDYYATRLPLIRKMFDKNLVVVKEGGRWKGVDRAPRPEEETLPDAPRGMTALYKSDQAHKLGLCVDDKDNLERNTIDQVLQKYNLPRSALNQFPEYPVVWRMVLSGPVNPEMLERVKRHVKRAVKHKANLLLLQLECGDGDSGSAQELGLFLARLNDTYKDSPIQTMAYVMPGARNTATFLAFGCDRIVMHPEARLGDFADYIQAHPSLEGIIRKNLSELAESKHHPAVLAQGMVDRDLRIHWVSSTHAVERQFMDEKDLKEDRNRKEPRWRDEDLIKPATPADEGKYLTLDAKTARRLRVAYEVTDNLDAVYQLIGVLPRDVRTSESDMLDQLGEFLRNPWTQLVLVMVGIMCLILELKMPGVTLPGVVAAICFLLFFWAHSQLNGQMTTLALLLFLLGLILLALEIFVIPGFGVCGISGVILVVGSLGLVAYGHWPNSSAEWVGYSKTLGPLGLSMLGAICLAFLLARYLPSIPFANRLMLRPQVDDAEEQQEETPAIQPELAALLGAIGVAATPLRPAGKTQFGDAFVDVVAEGSYIPPGSRVQVIEIEGNRVVVKEV